MNLPIKDTLTKQDFVSWGFDLINYFIVPVLVVFLSTLQTQDFQLAVGAAYGTAVACGINLLGKYRSGIDPKDIATLSGVEKQVSPDPIQPTISPVPTEQPVT